MKKVNVVVVVWAQRSVMILKLKVGLFWAQRSVMILKLKVGREFEAEFCSKILKLISDQYFCKMYDLKEVSFWLRCAFCNLSLYLPVKYLSRVKLWNIFFCKCSYSSYFVSLLHSHLILNILFLFLLQNKIIGWI